MLHPLLESALEVKNMRLDLKKFEAFEKKIGQPSSSFQSVHIGGTNGKGTVSFKLARALEELGLKVGLYTSPHIRSYHERIQVNRQAISESVAHDYLTKIKEKIDEPLTYFETLTLLAFLYFAEQKVDVAVLEVGMGGRLDTTNLVMPLLSIVVSIGFDHTRYLGKRLEDIAGEKAGIIKPGVPILIGPQAKPYSVFEKKAKEMGSQLFILNETRVDYEEENRLLVQKALTLLPYPITDAAREAAETARLPCRFEEVFPGVIFDVGHNPPALVRTFEKLGLKYPGKKVRALVAFSSDKEIPEMLAILKNRASFIHLTEAKHDRAWRLVDAKINFEKITCETNFEKAFEEAFILSRKYGEILLVSGTFFIMEPALSKLEWIRAHDL